jgi:hypothetical protein
MTASVGLIRGTSWRDLARELGASAGKVHSVSLSCSKNQWAAFFERFLKLSGSCVGLPPKPCYTRANMTVFNIYCDESCHLEHDGLPIMVFGAVWCPLEKRAEISSRIREIKKRHGVSETFEIKWSKVSPAKKDFYLDVLDYFFDDDDLHFRALVVPDKAQLRHGDFGQDHDTFYYKMFFALLKVLFNPHNQYRTYLDIKDTRSGPTVEKLHDVLCNNMYDFSRQIIERIQAVRSHEVQILQLTDLLVGIVSYANRGLAGNAGKQALVARMQKRSGYTLCRTTLLREEKVNLFIWQAAEAEA